MTEDDASLENDSPSSNGVAPYSYSPWDLTFGSSMVEKEYSFARSQNSLVALDRRLCQIKLAITAMFVVLIAVDEVPASGMATLFWLGYLAALIVQHTLLSCAPRTCHKYREQLILCLKLPYSLMLMGLIPTFVLEPVHGLGTFLKVITMGSGLVAVNCTGVLMPVRFRVHMISGSITCLFFLLAVSPALLDTMLCTPTSRGYTHSLYSSMDRVAQEVTNLLLPLNGQLQEAHLRPQAATLITSMHLCFGVVLPAGYLYFVELRSRETYLQQLHGHRSLSGLSNNSISQLVLPPLLLACSFMTMTMAVIWNLVSLMAPAWVRLIDSNPLAVLVDAMAASHAAGVCLAER